MKENQSNAYRKEYYDTLNRLWQDNSGLKELKYFLDTMYQWCSEEQRKNTAPKVVILGTSVPEELVMAAGAEPYFIIGGSLGSVSWSDELVPRDTDPVSRSVLGYIHQPGGADFSDSLFIVPLTSDSMRKIAFELKEEGRKVFVVDIPPDRTNIHAQKNFQMQMLSMTDMIAKHTGTRITKRSIKDAVTRVSRARRALLNFLEVTRGRMDIITSGARLLVQNSYYFTGSIDDWTLHLEVLTNEAAWFTSKSDETCLPPGMSNAAKTIVNYTAGRNLPAGACLQTDTKNNMMSGAGAKISTQTKDGCVLPAGACLLLGSPVIFPNYKVPFLVQDIGLDILDTADAAALKSHIVYDRKDMRGSCDTVICNIAARWYKYDASSAFVKNDILYDYVSWIIRRGDIEGVVYHVLKGQIEYDFELERFESLLSRNNIPVFRLETDYQYQDIEQLRIRMEAFSEMLVQNRYKIDR